ncbi:MAG: DUF3035 domain-containing protein [Acetobacteraceae bacterium]|nr:DUF3035 domain-containing protein [Acetobacteraceae bacterium]
MPRQSVPQHPSPRFTGTAALLAACTVLLAGCGSMQDITDSLGLTRPPPDEFVVTTRAPLQMPQQFTLPPPQPGMARPQEQSERRQAEAALVPETALATTPPSGQNSPGQQAIVSAAGPAPPTNIRAQVNAEVGLDKPQQTLTDKLMFWRDPDPPGTLVDPAREAQRLRENAALGQSAETGDTPIVQPKRRNLLGNIF